MSLSKERIAEIVRAHLGDGRRDEMLAATSCDGAVNVRLAAIGSRDQMQERAGLVFAALRRDAGADVATLSVESVDHAGAVVHAARFGAPPAARAAEGHRPIPGLANATRGDGTSGIPGVARVIAVGAGKGGVGKSTIAVNLAVGLARRGMSIGILDGDIYGPSLPTLLDLHALETVTHEGRLQPFAVHGVKAMTIGKLADPGKPLIWRGPMAHGAFKQLAEQTNWGELDYLIVDLPPGTGDVPLTMAQVLRLTGAVIVCTPQRVAQDDAERAARMFRQLGIEVLGVVENMSYFIGDDGREYDLFGRGGAEAMAGRLGIPFLGAVPISIPLRRSSDGGDPTANFTSGGALAAALERMVDLVVAQASLAQIRQGHAAPALKIS